MGLFVLLFALSYFFDCADGLYARRYDMTSRFGDVYDHVTDLVVFFGIAVVVMQRKQRPLTWHLPVLAVAVLLLNVSTGCQQRKKSVDHSETLDIMMKICPDATWIHWTRFFGPTTFNIVVVLLVLHLMRPPPHAKPH